MSSDEWKATSLTCDDFGWLDVESNDDRLPSTLLQWHEPAVERSAASL